MRMGQKMVIYIYLGVQVEDGFEVLPRAILRSGD